jgi:spore coat polysaccharide biosynthesis protein SpsF (cytidylyltransferase family)
MVLKKNKVLAIIQARHDSIRFPGKVLKKINNQSILEIIIKRLTKCHNISKIIVACSDNKNDIKIINLCNKLKIDYFVGSECNVLERFYKASIKFKGSNILRITADCPLIDYVIVDKIINKFFSSNLDYASNINPPTFPDGLDAEIFTFAALKKAHKQANTQIEREHIRPFMLSNKGFKKFNLESIKNYSSIRLTIDEPVDFKVIKNIVNHFKNNLFFLYEDIICLYKKKKSPDHL